MKPYFRSLFLAFAIAVSLLGCAAETSRGVAEGAAGGAAVGAIGGMMSALVFGGDIGDAAARGAVWGGSTGAVTGGVRGAQAADRNKQAKRRQADAEYDKLRRDIGDDAYRGLEALAMCRHTVAIAYAESAQADDNYEYSLAGYWLEVMSVAEAGRGEEAEAMLPQLVQQDDKLNSTEQARMLLTEVLRDLGEIRVENDMKRACGE